MSLYIGYNWIHSGPLALRQQGPLQKFEQGLFGKDAIDYVRRSKAVNNAHKHGEKEYPNLPK